MKPNLVSLAVLTSFFACGPQYTPRQTAIMALSRDPLKGSATYATHCVTCHGTNGRSGSAQKDTVNYAVNAPNVFLTYVIEGDPGMPPFGNVFSDQEIADLHAYVKGL